MSLVGARPDSPMELFRAKYDAEQHLRKSGVVRTPACEKIFVFGRGKNPIDFVSAADVAALLEPVIVDSTLRGRVMEIGGPIMSRSMSSPRCCSGSSADPDG
jgi:uncharacterized protein YbjT (DUF2867 family)